MAGAAALGASALLADAARAQVVPDGRKTPDPGTFRPGDFIWPKKGGQFVPYSGSDKANTVVEEEELTEERWQRLRIEYIRKVRSPDAAQAPDAEYRRKVADRLEEMTYTEFFHDYAAGITPGRYQTYGISNFLYVGHMAIIDIESATGRPMVIEAVLGQSIACRSCVERVPYDEWLKRRGDIYVWHGRVRDIDPARGARIAVEAAAQVQKPYEFMNWDLLDDSGFYCSKLAWYATYKATGMALDGDTQGQRFFWFSPLQAIRRTKEVELLFNPGNYQNL
jgi:cell wall-associated NlpC family hydrolase